MRWKGDTLVAAFQWFREPRTAPTWDRVAVKFSYDAGMTWTEPTPIVVDGIPSNYQRPFDPTLAVVNGRLRIDFSSNDVINYTFEPGARFDHAERAVIDLVNDTTVRFYGSGRISTSVWKGATHQPSRSMTSAGRSMTSDEGRFTTDVLGRRMEDPSGPGLFFEVTVDPDGSLTVRKFISDR